MMKLAIPQTDSIDELAQFWQSHDVTEFATHNPRDFEGFTFERVFDPLQPA